MPMTREAKNILAACAPFATWIGLQTLLPATALAYALRSAATLAVLLGVFMPRVRKEAAFITGGGVNDFWSPSRRGTLLWGLLGGLAVFILWVGPEQSALYRTWCCWPIGSLPAPPTEPSPYDPAVCGWPLTLAKLVGSAFIIAPAEEIFFRSFLYRWLQKGDFIAHPRTTFEFSAFVWMTLLFLLEHDRPLAAALAAVIYGVLYIRWGLVAAIVAHVLTNLLLAIYVIALARWAFW